ncbi:MAG: hypothetical protein RIR10_1422 [Planctomycetota bacterium]
MVIRCERRSSIARHGCRTQSASESQWPPRRGAASARRCATTSGRAGTMESALQCTELRSVDAARREKNSASHAPIARQHAPCFPCERGRRLKRESALWAVGVSVGNRPCFAPTPGRHEERDASIDRLLTRRVRDQSLERALIRTPQTRSMSLPPGHASVARSRAIAASIRSRVRSDESVALFGMRFGSGR